MNILLTNDDGYNSEGILLLKEKLEKYGTVVIIAPKEQMSAKSVSITLRRGVKIENVTKNTFICDGTPADCVAFGMHALDISFDLVVSGCNNGFNMSYDTMYSGTVGAALEALTMGIPSIAVSCDSNFHIVEKYFDQVFDYIQKHNLLSKEYLLNINFPQGEEVKDIQIATLYYNLNQYDSFFIKEEDGYHARRKLKTDYSDDKNSDCYLVRHGVVAITPLNKSYFSYDLFQKLKEKES